MSVTRKIGILGGTFDPPHAAHTEIARRAKEQLGLDRVLLVVAGNPYQKRTHASAEDRYMMTSLAAEGLDGIDVSRVEIDRKGPSYTFDTLEELRSEYPEAEVWLILGADALSGIRTWHRWKELLEGVRVCVVPRPGFPLEEVLSVLRERGSEYCVLEVGEPLPYSSTSMRRALSAGERPEGLHPAVARYIEQRGLYRAE